MLIETLIFYSFAALVVGSSLMVILSRNPVHGALFLVAAFVGSSGLWLLLQAEFLALALIFVYVGAVMTLFLFVVMMLNIDLEPFKPRYVRYMPAVLVISLTVIGLICYALLPAHFQLEEMPLPLAKSASYNNTREIGMVLYTDYMYSFELAAVILLVAIIAAISLAAPVFRDSKRQNIEKQLSVRREDRVRLVKMRSEKE